MIVTYVKIHFTHLKVKINIAKNASIMQYVMDHIPASF